MKQLIIWAAAAALWTGPALLRAEEDRAKGNRSAVDAYGKECLKVGFPVPAQDKLAEESERCRELLSNAKEAAARHLFELRERKTPESEFLAEARRLWPLLSEKNRQELLPAIRQAAGPKRSAPKAGAAAFNLSAAPSTDGLRDALGPKPSPAGWNKAFDGAAARGGSVPEAGDAEWARSARGSDPQIGYSRPSGYTGLPGSGPVMREVPQGSMSVKVPEPAKKQTWGEWGAGVVSEAGKRTANSVLAVAGYVPEAFGVAEQAVYGLASTVIGTGMRLTGKAAGYEDLTARGGLMAARGGALLLGAPVRVVNSALRPLTAIVAPEWEPLSMQGKTGQAVGWVIDPLIDDRHEVAGQTPQEIAANSGTTKSLLAMHAERISKLEPGWQKNLQHGTLLVASAADTLSQMLLGGAASKAVSVPELGLAGTGAGVIGAGQQLAQFHDRYSKAATEVERKAILLEAQMAGLDLLASFGAGAAMRSTKGGMTPERTQQRLAFVDELTGNGPMQRRLDFVDRLTDGPSRAADPSQPLPAFLRQQGQAPSGLRERLVSAPPRVSFEGAKWDVERVNPDGTVRLETTAPKPIFRPLASLEGSAVRYWGTEGTVAAASPEGIELRLEDGRELAIPAPELSGGKSAGGLIFLQEGSQLVARAVDDNGLARLAALQPSGTPTAIEVPIERLGSVPVRLKGRETEGLFNLSRRGGKFNAVRMEASGEPSSVAVTPDQVVGRHVEVDSPEFGTIPVDSYRQARSREATGEGLPLRAAQRSPSEPVVADPALGSLRGGRSMVGPGDAVLSAMVDKVRASRAPLTMNLFELELPPEGSNAPARELLDAVISHAEGSNGKGPQAVRIIYNPVRPLDPQVSARVAQAKAAGADIELVVPKDISHAKAVASPEEGFLMTGGLSAKAASKVELGVSLPREAAAGLHEYQRLISQPGSDSARRQSAAAALARQGVLVNDPTLAQGAYVTRGINGLLQGAEKSLQVYVKELKDAGATKTLIEQARRGVQVDIVVRNAGPEGISETSRGLILEALEKEPGLPLTLKSYAKGRPLPHGNLIVADDAQAYVGTAYLWSSHMTRVMPGGSAFDYGVLLSGADAVEVRRQFQASVPETVPVQ